MKKIVGVLLLCISALTGAFAADNVIAVPAPKAVNIGEDAIELGNLAHAGLIVTGSKGCKSR